MTTEYSVLLLAMPIIGIAAFTFGWLSAGRDHLAEKAAYRRGHAEGYQAGITQAHNFKTDI